MIKSTCLLFASLAIPQAILAAGLPDRTPEWAQWYSAEKADQQGALRKFYFDATRGDDTRSGDAPESAWKSLKRLKTLKLLPGDHLYLRRGGRFNEPLELDRVAGSPDAFIRVLALARKTRRSRSSTAKAMPPRCASLTARTSRSRTLRSSMTTASPSRRPRTLRPNRRRNKRGEKNRELRCPDHRRCPGRHLATSI